MNWWEVLQGLAIVTLMGWFAIGSSYLVHEKKEWEKKHGRYYEEKEEE